MFATHWFKKWSDLSGLIFLVLYVRFIAFMAEEIFFKDDMRYIYICVCVCLCMCTCVSVFICSVMSTFCNSWFWVLPAYSFFLRFFQARILEQASCLSIHGSFLQEGLIHISLYMQVKGSAQSLVHSISINVIIWRKTLSYDRGKQYSSNGLCQMAS